MSIKALGQQSLIYGFGHVMSRLVTFLLLPLYTHVFTQDQYGIISLAYAFIGFTMILYRYGMDTALIKYSVQEEGELRKKHITVILFSQLATGLIFSGILYVFREKLSPVILGSDCQEWMVYLSIILFLDSIWNLPMLILRSEEKPISFISLSLLNVVTTMGLNILFVVKMNKGIAGVFEANIIASGLIFILTLPMIVSRSGFFSFDKEILKKVIKFALPFLPAGIFTMIMELSDRYLLEWLTDTATVGLYSAGKKLGMLGLVAVMGFNMGWTPYFLKRGKEPGARIEFAKVTTLFLGILGFIIMIVILWTPEIMRFPIGGRTLIGSEFWPCEPVVSAILIGYFFFGTYVLQLPGIYMKKITRWVPVFRAIGASIMIVVGLVLIPQIGMMGASYAVIIAFFIMSVSVYLKTRNLYSVPYNWIAIIYPIIFLFFSVIIPTDFIINCVVSIIYPVGWYFFALNTDERSGLKKIIS